MKSFLRRLEKSEEEMKILAKKVEVLNEFDENLNTVVEENDSDYEEQAKVGDEDASSKDCETHYRGEGFLSCTRN